MDARCVKQQADSKLSGGFLKCFQSSSRFEEAASLYQDAANKFKLSKEWNEAAECYIQCSYCAQRNRDAGDEANFHLEAGNMYARVTLDQACEQYEEAVRLYADSGRFQAAGKLLLNMAETQDHATLAGPKSLQYYSRAVDFFECDEYSKSNLSKCRIRIAEIKGKDGEYEEAIKTFEDEARKMMGNSALKFGAKELFLKAGLLALVHLDHVTVTINLDRYRSMDASFAGSRECELLLSVAEAVEARDADAFGAALSAFDKMTPLGPWHTSLLLKVKDTLGDGGGDVAEVLETGEVDLT